MILQDGLRLYFSVFWSKWANFVNYHNVKMHNEAGKSRIFGSFNEIVLLIYTIEHQK